MGTDDLTDSCHPAFLSLRDARRQGVSIPVLATAIETHGVFGWDRFDRYGAFTAKGDDAERVLAMLARVHESVSDPSYDPGDDFDDGPGPMDLAGWPKGKCPDFEAIARASSTARIPPRPSTRAPNADRVLLGLLLGVIRGELQCAKHPELSTNTALINHLQMKGSGYDGLAKSTLEMKFSEAAKAVGLPSK